MALTVMLKIVNAALKAKAIKFGLEVKAWPRELHHCYRVARKFFDKLRLIYDFGRILKK